MWSGHPLLKRRINIYISLTLFVMDEDSNDSTSTDCWEFVQVLSKLIVLHAVGGVWKSHSLRFNNMGIVSNKKEKVLSLKKD